MLNRRKIIQKVLPVVVQNLEKSIKSGDEKEKIEAIGLWLKYCKLMRKDIEKKKYKEEVADIIIEEKK